MIHRILKQCLVTCLLFSASLLALPALAADEAADVLIKRLSTEVLDTIRADKSIQAGDVGRIVTLVDTRPSGSRDRRTSLGGVSRW